MSNPPPTPRRLLPELAVFGLKQVGACAFAGPFLAMPIFSRHIHIPWLARYDMLFLGAILIQAVLIGLKMETGREAAVLLIFRRTLVLFTVTDRVRRMPLLLSFCLIGFFVWVAENIATYFGAWVYPHQRHGWAMVLGGKIGSWTLLIIISFIIVAALKERFPTPEKGAGLRR